MDSDSPKSPGNDTTRTGRWKDIWTRKASKRGDDIDLHVYDGYDLFTEEQWVETCEQAVSRFALPYGGTVLEVGCGAGAFLAALNKIARKQDLEPMQLSGIDYCAEMVEIAKSVLEGEFEAGDAAALASTSIGGGEQRYDLVCSFGMVIYLNSLDDLRKCVCEMYRLCKPGGTVYIGEMNDLAKKQVAEEIRAAAYKGVQKVSTDSPTHLWIPRSFFEELVPELGGVELDMHSHEEIGMGYTTATYRFGVVFRKPA